MSIQDIADKLNFSDVDLVPPDEVVRSFMNQLDEVTNHYVIGVVEPYSGHIVSYKTGGIAALSTVISGAKEHDIQDDLGLRGYGNLSFECYLAAPQLEDYKFRICFFEYGIGGYPVKFVIEQGIADEINKRPNSQYIFKVSNRAELEELLNRIISVKKMIEIIQGIINESIIEKHRKPAEELGLPAEEQG